MSKFTPEEIAYFQSQRFGRLATVSPKGELHIAPVTFDYNALEDCIDIGGYNITATKKYRDAISHGRVAFLIDDILPSGQARVVEIRGRAEAVPENGNEIKTMYTRELLRIRPMRIVTFGLDDTSTLRDRVRGIFSSRNVE
jgi:pyridoxamine 5'-phosphate oxidase family protein